MLDYTYFNRTLGHLQELTRSRWEIEADPNESRSLEGPFVCTFEPGSPEHCDTQFILHQLVHNLACLGLVCEKILLSAPNENAPSDLSLLKNIYYSLKQLLSLPSESQRNSEIDKKICELVRLGTKICSRAGVASCTVLSSEDTTLKSYAEQIPHTVNKIFFSLYLLQHLFYGTPVPESMEDLVHEVDLRECMNDELDKTSYHDIKVHKEGSLGKEPMVQTQEFELRSIVSNVVINAITAINAQYLAVQPKNEGSKQLKKPLFVYYKEKKDGYEVAFKNEGKLSPEKMVEITALKNNTFKPELKGKTQEIGGVGIEECFRRSERIGIDFDLQNIEEDGINYVVARMIIPKRFSAPALENTYTGYEDDENPPVSHAA